MNIVWTVILRVWIVILSYSFHHVYDFGYTGWEIYIFSKFLLHFSNSITQSHVLNFDIWPPNTILSLIVLELAKDQAVRDCLMYIACLGGHIESVKKWYTPSTNVVGNILFVSDLNVCENRYPLFAACQGRSYVKLDIIRQLCVPVGNTDVLCIIPLLYNIHKNRMN